MTALPSIPRPVVRTNQAVIVGAVLLTWLTGVYGFLAIPLASGLLGLLLDFNPIMRMARLFLRRPPATYLQEDKAQQKFNQLLAVIFLAIALFGYMANVKWLAIVFSAGVAAAAFVAILGFCIGCFIHYQWHLYKHRHRSS